MLEGGGTNVATCYANRSPVEKSRDAKATPSNVEMDTGGRKTSRLQRSARKKSEGRVKVVTAEQASFVCTSDTCLEPVLGPSCKSWPSSLLDLIQTSLSQQQRQQKGGISRAT